MVIILEHNYPTTVVDDIVTKHLRVQLSDGELPGGVYAAVAIIASSLFEDGADGELSPRAKSLLNPYRISPYGL